MPWRVTSPEHRGRCKPWDSNGYRLAQEPARMWKRYLYANTNFIWMVGKQWPRQTLPVRDRARGWRIGI